MMQEYTDGFESNDDFRVEVREIEPHDIGKFHRSENLYTKNYYLPSAREISKVKHSLVPDMLNGWIPRKGVISPVPIHFDNPVVDLIVETLLKEDWPDKIMYLGPRYSNSYMLHSQLNHRYSFKYSHVEKYAHMLACFKGFYESLTNIRKQPFVGTNPAIFIQKIGFDSNFESANLDCAIKTSEDTYDLYLRVDSNTKGHCLWYDFKVRASYPHTATFNLCNLKRSASLYNYGLMHPYFRRTDGQWQQMSSSTCQFKTLKYNFLKNHFPRSIISYYNLSFHYTFQYNEYVYFAYCIPYTYSMLLSCIEELRGRQDIHVSTIGESLTGLDIPMLSFGTGQNCIVISARCHPGYSNGSWMAEQIVRSLAELPSDSPFLQYYR